jgi:hypothetical protein
MKTGKLIAVFAGAALFLAGTVWATNMTKKSLKLYDPVSLDGKTLQPGNYQLEWQGAGPKVEVSIVKQGSTVETAPARLQAKNPPEDNDGYITMANHQGTRSLSDVFFGGKNYELSFADSTGTKTSAVKNKKAS